MDTVAALFFSLAVFSESVLSSENAETAHKKRIHTHTMLLRSILIVQLPPLFFRLCFLCSSISFM